MKYCKKTHYKFYIDCNNTKRLPATVAFFLFLKQKKIGDVIQRSKANNKLLMPYIKAGTIKIKSSKTCEIVDEIKPVTQYAKIYDFVRSHQSFSLKEALDEIGCDKYTFKTYIYDMFYINSVCVTRKYYVRNKQTHRNKHKIMA